MDRKAIMSMNEIFKKKLDAAQRIIISTHLFPDADGIGSEIGLCLALRELGKEAICVNEVPLLDRYKYLDPQNVVIGLDELDKQAWKDTDLFIVVDTNAVERVGPHMAAHIKSQEKAGLLFIDHHPASDEVKKGQCIDTNSAATGQLVGELIESLGLEFTREIALPLYTAILIDTSSFRYPTVSGPTHSLIAKLVNTGVKPPDAYNGIYGTKKISHMHLLGHILLSADSNKSGEVAWIVLDKDLLEEFKTDIEDTHAFINHLLVLDNIKIAAMFRDDGHELKVSFRSDGEIDVGKMARGMGGGGHSHSAATILPKKEQKIKDLVNETVAAIEAYLKNS